MIINALNHVLFVFGTDQVTSAEILGFITGLACVYLVVRENVHNFWVGILNAAFFLVLFLHAKFYADSGLQIMFIVLNALGWWAWLKAGPNRTPLKISDGRLWEIPVATLVVIAVTAVLYPILLHIHDAAPWWDALTTGISVGAQLLLNWKRLPNWYFWIVADLIYIPLYFYKNLWLTGIVYVGFLTLCFFGIAGWRARKRQVETEKWIPTIIGTL
jgi:nicotinamide mononucleotide transporter